MDFRQIMSQKQSKKLTTKYNTKGIEDLVKKIRDYPPMTDIDGILISKENVNKIFRFLGNKTIGNYLKDYKKQYNSYANPTNK